MRLSLLAWLSCAGLIAACKDKPAQTTSGSGSGSAPPKVVIDNPDPHANLPPDAPPPPPGDWDVCKAGLTAAATAPLTRRLGAVIEACRPCGDWKPILGWQTAPEEGGPDRRTIETALANCNAWCNPNAKMRFMGTLDDARVKKTRTPWRELATQCGEAVSARPDGRYVNAPWFALDRIARWAAGQPDGPALLAALEIPLPLVSQTGVGVKLPTAPVMKPEPIDAQITLTAATITVGTTPRAKLSADGITPQGDLYPGAPVTLPKLAAAIANANRVAVFAPGALPAARVYDVVGAAKGKPLVLAAASRTSMEGWEQHGIVPVELVVAPERKRDPAAPQPFVLKLTASPDEAVKQVQGAGTLATGTEVVIELHRDATVLGLVTVLGALAYSEWPRVGLVRIAK